MSFLVALMLLSHTGLANNNPELFLPIILVLPELGSVKANKHGLKRDSFVRVVYMQFGAPAVRCAELATAGDGAVNSGPDGIFGSC